MRRATHFRALKALCRLTVAPLLVTVLALPWARAADDGRLTPVNLQLRWLHQFQFAGYYAARELGYYREAGLDVRIIAGAPGREPVKEVLEGRATYGVANSELLYQRLQGAPLVALAAIFQHSASVLLARQSSGIRSPQDLVGRKVMLISTGADVGLIAMLHKEGIDPARVQVIKSSYDINDLVTGKVEAFNSYLTNEPYYLSQLGIPYSIIYPSSYGVDFYSDILFTTEGELKENPERVKAFREASLRGWRYAMDHPEEVIDWILRDYSQDKTRDHLRFEASRMRTLILPDLVEIGHMNPGRWKHMADTFVELGMADPGFSLEGFIYDPEFDPDAERWLEWVRWLLWAVLVMGLLGIALGWYTRKLHRAVSLSRKLQNELSEQKALFEAIFHSTPNATLIADRERRILMCNPAFSEIFGYRPEEVIGRTARFIYADPQQYEEQGRLRFHPAAELRLKPFEVRYRRKNGREFPGQSLGGPIRDLEGQHRGYILVVRDITEQKQNEAAIVRMALTDSLTGLANRHHFNQRLEESLKLAQRQNRRVGLALMDLDLFKEVNDTYGHPMGDAVLREVARILRSVYRETDLIARIGGDEFAIIMFDPSDDSAMGQPCERVIAALSQPMLVEGVELQLGASMGVAISPLDARTAEDLYRKADRALYRSKELGRNRCTWACDLTD